MRHKFIASRDDATDCWRCAHFGEPACLNAKCGGRAGHERKDGRSGYYVVDNRPVSPRPPRPKRASIRGILHKLFRKEIVPCKDISPSSVWLTEDEVALINRLMRNKK